MSQKDNFHIDFASKVQESRDGKQVVVEEVHQRVVSGNSKVADVEKDDPLTKTFRRRDLKERNSKSSCTDSRSPNERNAPVVGPDGRRRPKRVPPPSKPPPPQESPCPVLNITTILARR